MATPVNPTDFSTSLFGCFSDFGGCIMTLLCPCYTVAKNKASVDSRNCTICDFCCAMPNLEYFTRQQIRARFNLPFAEAMDCIMFCVCAQCMICQDSREIALRLPAQH